VPVFVTRLLEPIELDLRRFFGKPEMWEGLALYPFCIAPHFHSDHPETKLIDQSVEYFIEKKLPFVALHDGEAIVFDTVSKESRVVGGHS
jgi:dipeptidase E